METVLVVGKVLYVLISFIGVAVILIASDRDSKANQVKWQKAKKVFIVCSFVMALILISVDILAIV